jgi:hypothetical protein
MLKAGIVLILCLLAVSSAEAQTPTPQTVSTRRTVSVSAEDFLGSLSGNVYSNRFFQFTLNVPENYLILNRAEIYTFSRGGAKMFKGASERNDQALQEAANNSISLIMVTRKAPGSPGNAAFELQVRQQPEGITADQVVAETSRLMAGSAKSSVSTLMSDVAVGNKLFAGAEFDTVLNGQKLKQRLLITMHRGYAISIGLTFTTQESLTAFDEMLKSMTFELL